MKPIASIVIPHEKGRQYAIAVLPAKSSLTALRLTAWHCSESLKGDVNR
ncbi:MULTISPECIES: hypothetical protein [Kosakonia]|nr:MULTISPECIES: hypothetical protein [Kosakonia]MDD7997143.1 hypothetical protein [Kosakonia radicincitans]